MAQTVGFIAATIPAKQIYASGTTLFHIAAQQTGDPLQWVAIAELNGITDPWIDGLQAILIPPVFPTGAQTGIMAAGPGAGSNVIVPVATPPGKSGPPIVFVTAPPTTFTGGFADMSIAGNVGETAALW